MLRAGTRQGSELWLEQRCLYFQRPVTLAFPRVLELQEKQSPSDGGGGGGQQFPMGQRRG